MTGRKPGDSSPVGRGGGLAQPTVPGRVLAAGREGSWPCGEEPCLVMATRRPPALPPQVPRTSEIYVHRSGRTARAANEGLSLMLIGPEDMINFKKIYKTLKKDEDIPFFPVQTKYMDAVRVRGS